MMDVLEHQMLQILAWQLDIEQQQEPCTCADICHASLHSEMMSLKCQISGFVRPISLARLLEDVELPYLNCTYSTNVLTLTT